MDMADPPGLPDSPTGEKEDRDERNPNMNHGEAIDTKDLEKQKRSEEKSEVEENGSVMDQGRVVDGEIRSEVPAKGSWVEVAKEKRVLKKYEIDINEKEGQKVVEIPDGVLENANHLWEDFLIGKFLDTAPHIARVHAVVNKIWTQGEGPQRVEVHVVDSTTMKFKVTNPMMRARILRRGMWNIGNVPLVVTKWTPEELEEKPEVKSILLWVHLKNVPMHMFSWQGLNFISSAAGFPVRLHPETASCSNFKLAKVFVNVDLSKELPSKINFTKNGKSFLVEFIYPCLPLRCQTCSKWGHVEKSCIMNKKDGVGLSDQIQRNMLKEDMEAGKNIEVIILVTGSSDSGGTKVVQLGINMIESEEGQIKEGWEDVNTGKSRSPTKRMLSYGQEKLTTTPSRFMVLNEINDDGELNGEKRNEEVHEEKETVEQNMGEVSTIMDDFEEKIITKEEETIREEEGKLKEVDKEDTMVDIESEVESVVGKEVVVKSLTYCEILKSPTYGDTGRVAQLKPAKTDLVNVLRPSLPRVSKANHKVFPEKLVPGNQGRNVYKKTSI